MEVKYPEIHVQLTGEDGNIFSIIGRVRRGMKHTSHIPETEIEKFTKEVTSCSSYDEALQTIMRWVDVG